MRGAHAGLLLIAVSVLLIFSSLSMRNQALALSGTGAGIRLDGPLNGSNGETIAYAITVFNLGDFWIRNATVTDTFPNGTSSSWEVPDLAPIGQLGNTFEIPVILYVIQDADMNTPGNPPYIINHVEVIGYSDVQGQSVLVGAEANHLLFIVERPAGGYSVVVKTAVSSTPTAIYITLLFIVTAGFSVFRRTMTRTRVVCKHRKKGRTPPFLSLHAQQ